MSAKLEDSLTEEDIRLSFSADQSQFRPLTRSHRPLQPTLDSWEDTDDSTSLSFTSRTSRALKRQNQHHFEQAIEGRKLKREEEEEENSQEGQEERAGEGRAGQEGRAGEGEDSGEGAGERELSEKQQLIRGRMRQLDLRIRDLQMQRNRLKYFLRREKDVQSVAEAESLETKECPCCGKLISKLCFRCEHLYCKVENCPRKKKQRLNARMLEKMREKVKGPRTKRAPIKERPGESGSDSQDYSSEDEDLPPREPKPVREVRAVEELASLTFSSEFRDSQIFFDE